MKNSPFLSGMENSIKIRGISLTSACMHLTFMIEFLCFGMYLLACFNVVSFLFYTACTVIWSVKPQLFSHSKVWICAQFGEIVLHAALCTVIQGLQTGFYLYIITSIPVIAYSLFLLCDMKLFRRLTIIFGIISAVVLASGVIFVENVGTILEISGWNTIPGNAVTVMRSINIAFNLAMAFGYTFLFYLEVTGMLDRLQQTNDQLNFTATHDALTGLFNRYSLWDFFEGLEKSGDNYCVIMGDLDDFKKINDTYGHDCGDRVLKSVACILLNHTNSDEMACRWGGEEMLLLIRGTREECLSRVGEIREQINGMGIVHEGQQVRVSMTFGFVDCAEQPEETVSSNHAAIDWLISVADDRLYTGKRSGKNVVISV